MPLLAAHGADAAAARGREDLAPALVLAGDRDLSTPLPWPRAELKLLPTASS